MAKRTGIRAAGIGPDTLSSGSAVDMDLGSKTDSKAWKTIWSAGQGIGSITDVPAIHALVRRLSIEYEAAGHQLTAGLIRRAVI